MKTNIYRCAHCGNVVMMMGEPKADLVCCGEKMSRLEANTTDAATEKHVPVVERHGKILSVTVGDVLHPMTPEHFIQWIMVVTGNHTQIHYLTPDDEPKAEFDIGDATQAVVYEYCNLHGLWKTKG